MKKRDDGGAAFPGIVIANPGEWAYGAPGMSLRDWFAANAPQPGWTEMLWAAGNPKGVRADRFGSAALNDGEVWGDQWFQALTLTERYRLYSICNYAYADAMLERRATPGETT